MIKIDHEYYKRPVEEAAFAKIEQPEFEKKFWELLNSLSPREYEVLALSIHGFNHHKLMADLGVSRQEISQIKKRIAIKLKKI